MKRFLNFIFILLLNFVIFNSHFSVYASSELTVKNRDDLYLIMEKAIKNIEDEISFKYTNYSRQKLLDDYKNNQINLPFYSGSTISISGNVATIQFSYRIAAKVYKKLVLDYNTELKTEKEKQLYSKVNDILKWCKRNTKYDTELAIHDYIIDNCEYSYDVLDNQDAYYLLMENKGVCNAYAEAAYMLLNAANIECIVVKGKASNENETINHAWNQVKLDDNSWYELDITWDSPLSNNQKKTYTYFNLTTEIMKRDHFRDKGKYNNCVSDKYSYYRQNNIDIAKSSNEIEPILLKQLENTSYRGSNYQFCIYLLYDFNPKEIDSIMNRFFNSHVFPHYKISNLSYSIAGSTFTLDFVY